MMFSGTYKSTLERTGKLPAGTYQLSVQLTEPGNFAGITPVQTRVFNLAAPQLPYLISPANHDSLEAKKAESAIIFRWTPLIPKTQEQPYYRLQVFDILPYQQPMQALRGNKNIWDRTGRRQRKYILRPQKSFTTDSIPKRFVWTIQTLDINQQPFIQTSGNGESRSEPFFFSVERRK